MNDLKTKKINRLPKQTSLKLQWNMSIADYNNNRISEEELKLKFNELKSKLIEVVDSIPISILEDFDWRLPKDVIDLKQHKQSFDNKLKVVA